MNMTRALLSLPALLAFISAPAHAQDQRLGEKVFAQCQACHSVDGTNGLGPSLKGIGGRKAAALSDFHYSRAMSSAALVWDAATLDAFIADPQKVVPGTMMPFAGLDDAAQRAALVAFLMSLK